MHRPMPTIFKRKLKRLSIRELRYGRQPKSAMKGALTEKECAALDFLRVAYHATEGKRIVVDEVQRTVTADLLASSSPNASALIEVR